MEIQAVCDQIEIIGKAITGMATAYSEPPEKMDTAMLPCLFVMAGDADYDLESLGDDMGIETGLYRLLVAIAPYAEANLVLLEKRARALMDDVRDAFVSHQALDTLTDTVLKVTPVRRSAFKRLAEYGGEFVGFEITLRVQTMFANTFASGE